VAAGAEGLTEGSAEASLEGSSRMLAVGVPGVPQVVVEGHRGHLPRLCDEHHKGAPGGAFERPLLGVFGGVSERVKEVVTAAVERSAQGLGTSS
jgi:hypothetical protein